MQIGIVGSGNIGTDLLLKVDQNPKLELAGVAGVDPSSDGLRRARELGYTATHEGLERLLELEPGIELAFDATSAKAHVAHAALLAAHGVRSVDLTPAAIGPAVVPSVNLADERAREVNLVTCGAQATVPVVAALSAHAEVRYAEIVSTISALSAGPGTRANIDEFTVATARSLESVGGAARGKALIILNPADPPVLMRNTVYADTDAGENRDEVLGAVVKAVEEVSSYVPGYRLTADPICDEEGKVVVLLEVRGAGDYLPPYAGNLDIMTSAAVRVAEVYAQGGAST